MSLGDLGKSINSAGNKLYSEQKERILREGEQRKKMEETREKDKLNQDISHLRLHKQTLEGRIMQIKNEIMRERDPKMKSYKETELRKLLNDKVHLEGEMMTLQGRERAAHNLHYNNPHYF